MKRHCALIKINVYILDILQSVRRSDLLCIHLSLYVRIRQKWNLSAVNLKGYKVRQLFSYTQQHPEEQSEQAQDPDQVPLASKAI